MGRKGFFTRAEIADDGLDGHIERSLVSHCGKCKLNKGCLSPRMPPTGKGKKGVLIVAEAPGEDEDRRNEQLVGRAGQLLRSELEDIDVDLDEDCWKTNAIICRPPKNETPDNVQIECCRPNLLKTIDDLDPKVIILLGKTAVKSLIGTVWKDRLGELGRWVGYQIRSQNPNAWICPTYHPSYLQRLGQQTKKSNNSDQVHRLLFRRHLKAAFEHEKRPWKKVPDYKRNVELIQDPEKAARRIRKELKAGHSMAAFDYETNMLKPDGLKARIVSASICFDGKTAIAFPWQGAVIKAMKRFLDDPIPKIAANLFMEDRWSRVVAGHAVNNWDYDTCIGAHVEDNRSQVTGLKFQAFVHCGLPSYDSHLRRYLESDHASKENRIDQIDVRDLLLYNGIDSLVTYKVAEIQRKNINTKPRRKAYSLLHNGILTLSKVSSNGIPVDVEALDSTTERLTEEIEQSESELKESSLWDDWCHIFGSKASLTARNQLARVLFEELGYKIAEHRNTQSGQKKKADGVTLEQIDLPFVHKWLRVQKLRKGRDTFLKGIRREVAPDGRLHPSYSLNIARTYRSSSYNPNSQNWPVRDQEMSGWIRRCFRARPGHVIVEVDYGQIEVRVAACYNEDPVLTDYICDPEKDMHRDMAAECFMLPNDLPPKYWKEHGKKARFYTKNQFVFPEFYGSYYVECARNLWEAMEKENLQDPNGRLLIDWLRDKGIKGRGKCEAGTRPEKGTFERHIRDVENHFWNERFKVYTAWKENWWKQYLRTGEFETLTGFRLAGRMAKNDVINYPIQGSAFHCLLWSLTELQRRIEKRGLLTKLIGQIHDSIIAEVPVAELDDFLQLAKYVMVTKLRKTWSWITVPLEVEAEVTPEGGSWFEKEEREID